MTSDQRPSGTHAARRLDNLAMAYQEMLTVIVRLRSGRQDVTDLGLFRSHVTSTLRAAEDEARAKGYASEDIRVTTFAVVGFLDESILNSGNPSLAEWLRRPLQEEMFGVQIAGEIFFRNVDRLLTREDSQALADVLEVYDLCLLLGFRGRYGAGDTGNLKAISGSLRSKIERIRGRSWPASFDWAPQREPVQRSRRAGASRRFAWTAGGIWIAASVLFAAYAAVLSTIARF